MSQPVATVRRFRQQFPPPSPPHGDRDSLKTSSQIGGKMLGAMFRAGTPASSPGSPGRKGITGSPSSPRRFGSPSSRVSSPQLSQAADEDDFTWFRLGAFHPYSEFRISLESAYLVAGVYTIIATFFLVCFRKQPAPSIFLVSSGLADAVFIADAVVSSITGWSQDA